MDATILSDVRAVEPLPDDLRLWLSEQELGRIVRKAVELVDMPEFYFDSAGYKNGDGKTMLTLLSYCYAVDCCGSEDVQWATEQDFAARSISGGACLDWRSIRQFRIKNWERIEQCLVRVSTTAVAQKFLSSDCDLKYAIPMACILAWARRKIQ